MTIRSLFIILTLLALGVIWKDTCFACADDKISVQTKSCKLEVPPRDTNAARAVLEKVSTKCGLSSNDIRDILALVEQGLEVQELTQEEHSNFVKHAADPKSCVSKEVSRVGRWTGYRHEGYWDEISRSCMVPFC